MQKDHDQGIRRRRLFLQIRIGFIRKEIDNLAAGARTDAQRQSLFQKFRKLFRGTFRRRLRHPIVFSKRQQEIADPTERENRQSEKES